MRKRSIALFLTIGSVCQGQNTFSGSGFFISPKGYLLTNLHVVKGCETVRFKIHGLTAFASILSSDARSDLALLKYDQATPFLSFRDDQRFKLGESVVVAGYPLAGVVASSLNLTTGNVSALAGLDEDTRMLQFTAPIQPGNSGGPLLDQSGHVVGIVTSKLSPLWAAAHIGDIPQNVNFALKISVVKDFLDGKGIEYTSSASTAPLTTPDIAEQAGYAVVAVECTPGERRTAMSGASGFTADARDAKQIQRLRDVKIVAIGSLGNSDAAALVREKISNRLVKLGKLTVVDDPQRAEAVLSGIVGADFYGRAAGAAFQLVTVDGRIIWVGENNARGLGSRSTHLADRIANELLKAMDADSKPK
jgi:S1-C subfamily serine protease